MPEACRILHSGQMEFLQHAFISAGSNLGDRKSNLEFALKALQELNVVHKVSSYFETEPVGFEDQEWFLNIVIGLKTRLGPHKLLAVCQKAEAACGRVRTFANAPRTLDLDILLYGNRIINETTLIIPHPRQHRRRFVLEPFAEIAAEEIHPVLKKSIRELLETCGDSSRVRIIAF